MPNPDFPLFYSSSSSPFFGVALALKVYQAVSHLFIPPSESVDEDAPPRESWRASPEFYKKSPIVICIFKAGWAW